MLEYKIEEIVDIKRVIEERYCYVFETNAWFRL